MELKNNTQREWTNIIVNDIKLDKKQYQKQDKKSN